MNLMNTSLIPIVENDSSLSENYEPLTNLVTKNKNYNFLSFF